MKTDPTLQTACYIEIVNTKLKSELKLPEQRLQAVILRRRRQYCVFH